MKTPAAWILALVFLAGCVKDLGIDNRTYSCRLDDPSACGEGWTCVQFAADAAGQGRCVIQGDAVCTPDCTGRECGPDGCGGTCGTCKDGKTCVESQGVCKAACTPSCLGRECGPDGCGGKCGTCTGGLVCNTNAGLCEAVCVPSCQGRECGFDGCTGTCGTCMPGLTCNTNTGVCEQVCQPFCGGRECGTDGCNGTCGTCPEDRWCEEGAGTCEPICVPSCNLRDCGPDGCGGNCGTCPQGLACSDVGRCYSCTPDCTGAVCGNDGCGGICGYCPMGALCVDRQCEPFVHCDTSCRDYVDCLASCASQPTGTSDCANECGQVLSVQGAERWTALDSCWGTSCGASSTGVPTTCVQEKCTSEFFECYGGCKLQTCPEVAKCLGSCMPSDTSCSKSCWDAGTAAADKALFNAQRCLKDKCPVCSSGTGFDAGRCERCQKNVLATHCRPAWEPCVETGTRGCGAASACIEAVSSRCTKAGTPCRTDSDCAVDDKCVGLGVPTASCDIDCAEQCLQGTSVLARDRLQALYKCLAATCDLGDLVGWETCVGIAKALGGACHAEAKQCE